MSASVDTAQLDSLGLLQKRPRNEKAEMGQEDFMKLMMTQLQNQDPMKPMENGDFLAQIAQFSAVNGITELQKSFDTLASSLYSSQALQATGLVDKNVLVPSKEALFLGDNSVMAAAVDIDNGVDELKVIIKDSVGQTIKTLDLGPQNEGRIGFTWDGKNDAGETVNSGVYEIEAIAKVAGEKIGATTLAFAPVESISLGGKNGSVSLNLMGLGAKDFTDVREIL